MGGYEEGYVGGFGTFAPDPVVPHPEPEVRLPRDHDWLLEAVARVPQETGSPTFVVVGPIPFTNASFEDELNRDGSLEFSVRPERLPPEVKNQLRTLSASPLEAVFRYRETVMFAGPVWTYGIQGGTLTCNARGVGGYLRYMQIDADTGDLTFTGVDQFTIAKALVDAWQALPYGHFGIDTSGVGTSGVARDREYIAHERHQVYQRLVELCEVADGFDWHVDPATRELVLETVRGVDLSDSVFFDLRNVTSSDEQASVAAGDVASEVFGVATGGEHDQPPMTSQQANASLRQAFGRVGHSETFDGVTEQATLNSHTQRELDERAEMLAAPGPGLMPVRDADVNDFGVGDTVSYMYDAGLGVRERESRVVKKRVQVGERGNVEMAVEFA